MIPIPNIMKFIVIVLLIAVCFQDTLCSPTPHQSRKSAGTKANQTSSDNDDKELVIVGEKGKVYVNGKFHHKDSDLNDGQFEIDVTRHYVYLNGKQTAKNSKISEENVDKYEMKITLGANANMRDGKNGEQPKPESLKESGNVKNDSADDKELVIVGEKGKVFVNGKFHHKDEDLNEGRFEIDVTRHYLYLNGKLITRNSKISEENVDKYEMKITLGANANMKYGKNGEQPKSLKEAANVKNNSPVEDTVLSS